MKIFNQQVEATTQRICGLIGSVPHNACQQIQPADRLKGRAHGMILLHGKKRQSATAASPGGVQRLRVFDSRQRQGEGSRVEDPATAD